MKRPALRLASLVTILASLASASGCGDDDDAQSACNEIVAALTDFSTRCNQSTAWDEEFPCDSAKSVDRGKADQCITDLKTLACGSSFASSCADALQ